ncbi:Hypothetical predicted protein [Paramuricea clavata]|uniref:Uncharacterized protein n=1 Tax=Paramuricea clavata TaxID=317549 RepID=A0A7D9IBN8_PARCT|nr:Hypothetical predicted protein [Paramuricea clavata]
MLRPRLGLLISELVIAADAGSRCSSVISRIYDKVFYDNEDISKANINLEGVSSDIYADSENESEMKDEFAPKQTPTTKSSHKTQKKPRESHHTSSRISSPLINNKKRRHNKLQSGTTPSEENHDKIDIPRILEYFKTYNNRLENLENIISKLDKSSAESDFEIKNLKNQSIFKDEANDLLVQKEKEINQLRGRVASLIDEKCNLIKRITVLEEQAKKCDTVNKAPFSTSQNSGKPTNENYLDDQSNETDLVVQLEDLTKTDIAESSRNDVENPEELKSVTHCETELQENNKEITSQNTNAETQKTPNYDFVMLCDSNRRYLDINKQCSSNNTKMIACGVNDVEHLKPEKIIEDQVHLVEAASHNFPGRKIIFSDITRRTDNLDQAIININNDIHERIKDLPNVQHVYNGNLRQYKFFCDTKHLSKRLGIPLLAKNLKNYLRRALCPQQRQGNSCQQTSNPQPQARNQSHTMAPETTPPAPVPMSPLNQPSVNAQIETSTLKHTVTVQEQLQNMNNLLNHFVSIFNFGQPELLRVINV